MIIWGSLPTKMVMTTLPTIEFGTHPSHNPRVPVLCRKIDAKPRFKFSVVLTFDLKILGPTQVFPTLHTQSVFQNAVVG